MPLPFTNVASTAKYIDQNLSFSEQKDIADCVAEKVKSEVGVRVIKRYNEKYYTQYEKNKPIRKCWSSEIVLWNPGDEELQAEIERRTQEALIEAADMKSAQYGPPKPAVETSHPGVPRLGSPTLS